jgi:phosphatidylglycerol---prolipoprotein diacylglyceryl transferase
LHPLLFTVPGTEFVVSSYGFFMGLALVTAWVLALLLARKDGLPSDRLGTVFVVAAVLGLLCARAVWLTQQGLPLDLESLRSLPTGGMTVFGGAFAALLVCVVGCRRIGVPLLAWLDCVAPAFALGAIFERFGALLGGGDFGRYVGTGEFGHGLAVTYPPGSPAFTLHVFTLRGLPGVSSEASAPVHPVQAYEALLAALTLAAALWMYRRRAHSGQVFFTAMAVFVAGRALLDPLRHDASPEIFGPLRLAQVSGLGLLLVLWIAGRVQAGRAASTPGGLRAWEGGPWSAKA